MYARIVEFVPRAEKREEIISVVRREILPILKRQMGFLEFLPFVPENASDCVIAVTLWAEKREAESYERDVFPKVQAILEPYLLTPVTLKHYNVETALCQHFAEALWSEV